MVSSVLSKKHFFLPFFILHFVSEMMDLEKEDLCHPLIQQPKVKESFPSISSLVHYYSWFRSRVQNWLSG